VAGPVLWKRKIIDAILDGSLDNTACETLPYFNLESHDDRQFALEDPRGFLAQALRDPLYGALFENLVVIESLKHRYNNGLRSNLKFYRDSAGNEVDLLLEQAAEF